uniref:C2H2-type domain-containing protein n=2 Tax=Sphaeramia orbicularis TaxID=375764 RepID=A0A672Y466_9TELE
MNGAVYISFFQGQLESVLEQVVQLAVQEISKTVGSSLNAMLLETAVKEQENHRLRLQLQSRESRDGGGGSAAKTKAGEERADGGRTKHEPPPPPPPPQPQQQQPHAPGGQGTQLGVPTDGRRLEQRGRVVDQLKSVMERVLDFAVCELTKIVEASFDDLLLEITKMEREQQTLEERLGRSSDRGGGDKGRSGGGRRRGSENDSVSPSGSEDAREEVGDVTATKETTEADGPDPAPVLSVSQDWVPILDKVFGQKWCSDVWHIKELEAGGGGAGAGGGGRSLHSDPPHPSPSVNLEPSPSSPQQDPRWTPLEDMEVFSPDEDDAAEAQGNATGRANATTGPSPSPTGSSGRRSSASMLHRLLTLPSQLLEDDEDAAAKEALAALATEGAKGRQDGVELPAQTCPSPVATKEEEEEDEEEEEEEEDRGRKKKRRRIWSECGECGRRFSRVSLLKAHRQTHIAESASPSSPAAAAAAILRCSECGKKFSSATRLHSHIRTQHPGIRS